MLSRIMRQSAAVALWAAAVNSQATPTSEPLLDAGDIETFVPTEFLAPAEVDCTARLEQSKSPAYNS